MGVEIERKFLVDLQKWNDLVKPRGVAYIQGYIIKEPSKTVRVRIAGDNGYITIKGKSIGAARSEYEYQIPKADADELLNVFCELVITKTRYNIPHANKLWEVDVFLAQNEGLIVAEIELDSELEVFEYPDWITDEVTGDVKYYNSMLSVNPYKNW